MTRAATLQRFEANYIPEPNSGCWLWMGMVCEKGYGSLRVDGQMMRAHRFSYRQFKGDLVPGLELDHLCRQRCCVNPDHLEQVTHAINMARSRPHLICQNGHPWNEENTWRAPVTGWRQCRQCHRDAALRRKLRKECS